MERLTERDEYGNADIIGVLSETLYSRLGFDDMNRVTSALNRLAAYEDAMPLERVQELAWGEKEGRIVVLPKGTVSMLLALFVDGGDNGMVYPSVEMRGTESTVALLSYAVRAVAQSQQVDYNALLAAMMSIPPCGAVDPHHESEQVSREDDENG